MDSGAKRCLSGVFWAAAASYGINGGLRTGKGGVKHPAVNATTASMTAYSFDSDNRGL